MELVKFINSLIDFGLIGDKVNAVVEGLPFHFVLHPAVVHFALVLPLLALVFQLMALVTKNVTYRRASNYLFFFGVIAVVAASISGRIAGPDVKPLLNGAGQELFNEHMQIGYALALFYILLLLLKFVSIFVNKRAFRIVMALLLVAGVGGLFVQAQHGGELVYKYAGGVTVPDEMDDDEDEEEEVSTEVSQPAAAPEEKAEAVPEEKKETAPEEKTQEKSEEASSDNNAS